MAVSAYIRIYVFNSASPYLEDPVYDQIYFSVVYKIIGPVANPILVSLFNGSDGKYDKKSKG